MFRQRHLCQGQ